MAAEKEDGPLQPVDNHDPSTAPSSASPSDSDGGGHHHQPSQSEKRASVAPPAVAANAAAQPPESGIVGALSRLGDLPEWSFRGEKLQGRALNYSIGFIASCGFLMFGYDQGVLSSLLTLDDFQRQIPLMAPREQSNDICWLDNPDNTIPDPDACTGSPNTQAACVAIYQIGCFLGAVVVLFYGESWGRKSSTFWGSLIMILGK